MPVITLTEAEAELVYVQLRSALTRAQEQIEDAKHWADEYSDDDITEATADAFLLDSILNKLL